MQIGGNAGNLETAVARLEIFRGRNPLTSKEHNSMDKL